MKPRFARLAFFAIALEHWGCIDSAQEPISIPLEVSGTAPVGPIPGRDGFQIELSTAELAFGPLYLCAGALAGDNCDSARLEWLQGVVVDALDPSGASAGELTGVSGPVRSAMYDFGIASLLSLPEPVVLGAAEALGGNSLRLSGVAIRGEDSVQFALEMPVQHGAEAELGVSVVRVSGVESLEHEVTGAEVGLRLRFDPTTWLSNIDFQSVLAESPAFATPHRFEPSSQAQQAVRAALLSGPRPTFEWITP